MADPHPGWHYREVVERLLRPAQQRVALSIARVLPLDVAGIGTQGAERIHLDGVVDDEIHLDHGIDPARILAGTLHRRSHGRQVDDGRHAREILQQDARGEIGHLGTGRRRLWPAGEGAQADVIDLAAFDAAEQALEQDLDSHRQAARIADTGVRQP